MFVSYFQPKYIHNIIKHAEKRKLEDERRTERKVQQEREAEGDEFADKESFVTASYIKKMEELKKAEAEANLEAMQEGKYRTKLGERTVECGDEQKGTGYGIDTCRRNI